MADPTRSAGPPTGSVRSPADLGAHLRSARRTRGITQTQAALLAGVGVRLWNEAENGRRAQVGLVTVLKMLAVVGMEVQVAVRPVDGLGTDAAPRSSRQAETDQDGQIAAAG